MYENPLREQFVITHKHPLYGCSMVKTDHVLSRAADTFHKGSQDTSLTKRMIRGFPSLCSDLHEILWGTPFWEKREEVAWYADRCVEAGIVVDVASLEVCVRRYMAGKRKLTPPFTKTRKRAAIRLRKALAAVPVEVLALVEEVCSSNLAEQYKQGNAKALNAMVGMVLKKHKMEPAAVKQLLINRMEKSNAS